MDLTRNQIIEKVKNAGVVGAGGAGFPAHIKLNANVDTLIANAASCEPLVHSDFSLMTEFTDKLLKGMSIVLDVTGAKEGYIAIKKKHRRVLTHLKQALAKYDDTRIQLFEMDDFYPAGDEFILVYEVTGRTIPERALPLEVGCLVQNVTTLVQIYEAIEDKPVTHRLVTITGEVNNPIDVILPLGTSFKETLQLAGGPTIKDYKIIHGGPMMGTLVNDPSTETVTKTTGMILVLPSDHHIIQKKKQPISTSLKLAKSVCCQCSMCTDLCPRGLIGHPLTTHKIMRTIAFNLTEPAEQVISAYLCSECGLCSMYSCSMGLVPHMVNSEIKGALAAKNYKYSRINNDYEIDKELRDQRKVPTKRLISRLGLTNYADLDVKVEIKEFIPDSVNINLQQHIGMKALPVVKKGNKVKMGEIIASIPEGKLGANIHASISGTVKDITENQILIKRS
jgi:Na+-translocating ferredoxin:NAD+ oxidoreductase RnfC subunit